MSNPKIKLTPKMVEALEYIDAYRNAGPYKERTLRALVERGLVEHTDRTDAVRAGAAWGYRVTDRGYDVFSSTQRRSAEARTVETEDPAPTYADDEFESYADYCGDLSWDELTREADRVESVKPATATKLYDRLEQKTMHVLGADVADGLFVRYESDDAVVQRIDGKVLRCSPDFVAVCDHGYAVHDSCPGCDADDDAILSLVKYGTQASDHIGNGRSIELGTVVFHPDCTRSAINPLGDIVARRLGGDSWKAAHRALVLDHRMHARRLAEIEQEARAVAATADARQAEVDAELLGDDVSAEILVRTLISYGVTTGAQFERYAAKILAHDDRNAKVARSLSEDQIITAPSAAFTRTMDAFSRIPKMPTSLAALVSIRRDEKGQK